MITHHDPVFGCILADGRKDRDGYVFWGSTRAHRHAWESANGPIPEGMEVEHQCRRRDCVAPHHLELVTRCENEKRKSWKYRAKRTHCSKGHELSASRMVTPEGGVLCRVCNEEAKGRAA